MRLAFEPPLDAEGLLRFLGRRAIPGVEAVTRHSYRRTLRLAHGPAVVALTLLESHVAMDLRAGDPRDAADAAARCRALLDLDADPVAIDTVLRADPQLARAVRERPGRRVPGKVDSFELCVRAIVGQQVSVEAAHRLAARIVAGCGPLLPEPDGSLTRLFPAPGDLLGADPAILTMPASRREALLGLARAWPCSDRDALLAVPGVGPWTADYVAMRSGDRDVLPAGDAALRAAMRQLAAPVEPDRWRPFRSYALMHLWDLPETG